MNEILGLYIHIPFCDHICAYCDFKKMIASNDLKEQYINALIKEIEYKKNTFKDLKSIYIGGGTPSSLSFNLLERLLSCLNDNIKLEDLIEFSIEANPKDINEDNIKEWIVLFNKYHINRLSLGIQSFDDNKLSTLNRNHNKKDAIKTLKLLHQYHFDNVNCDLIYGLIDDNFRKIKKDLKYAINNHVKHISYYSLILEEHTLFYNLYQQNKFKELDDDKEGILYNKILKYLNKHHLKRYEISNFAYDNYQSYHNLITWNNNHYQALGVSASSYIDNIRYTNIKSVKDYIKLINEDNYEAIIGEKIVVSDKDIMDEFIILGLRKNDGINIKEFEIRYHQNLLDVYKSINNLIDEDILEIKDGNLRIKYDKIYLENAILNKIL
ncbi:MAG: radical SAM family heme chaperone HemW [Bacilli bacterium]|nr:radical SAM family heme chaperone HemW [Bacilli bacterium]